MIGLRSGTYLVVASFLTACGGGGGDDAPPPTDEVLTKEGVFLDSPVEGLYYTAGDMTGYTDNEGRFYYSEGSTVNFSIGDISLGSALGNAILTPKSLLPGLENRLDRRLTNQLRLLQTLDSDANPENGIQLYSQVHNYLAGQTINFDLSETDFAAQTAIRDLLRLFGKDQLVAPLDALEHFYAQQLAVLNPSETEWTEITRLEFEAALEPGTEWQSRRKGSYSGTKQEGNSSAVLYPVSYFEQEALDIKQYTIDANRNLQQCESGPYTVEPISSLTSCLVSFNLVSFGGDVEPRFYRAPNGNLKVDCPEHTTDRSFIFRDLVGNEYGEVNESFTTQFERTLIPINRSMLAQTAVKTERNGEPTLSSINCIEMQISREDPHGDQTPEVWRHKLNMKLYGENGAIASVVNSYDILKTSSGKEDITQRYTYFTINGRQIRKEGGFAPAVSYQGDTVKTSLTDSATGTTYTINVSATPTP